MEVSFSAVKVKSTTETSGVGTPRRSCPTRSERIRTHQNISVSGCFSSLFAGQGTEGHAGQLALGGRQHFTHSLGGSGRARDDVAGSSTASSPVLARMNTQTIDASERTNGTSLTALDYAMIFQHFNLSAIQ